MVTGPGQEATGTSTGVLCYRTTSPVWGWAFMRPTWTTHPDTWVRQCDCVVGAENHTYPLCLGQGQGGSLYLGAGWHWGQGWFRQPGKAIFTGSLVLQGIFFVAFLPPLRLCVCVWIRVRVRVMVHIKVRCRVNVSIKDRDWLQVAYIVPVTEQFLFNVSLRDNFMARDEVWAWYRVRVKNIVKHTLLEWTRFRSMKSGGYIILLVLGGLGFGYST